MSGGPGGSMFGVGGSFHGILWDFMDLVMILWDFMGGSFQLM